MKVYKLIAVASLGLLGYVAYADNAKQDNSKVMVNKLKSEDATARTPGGLLVGSNRQPDNNETELYKKRIQELEDLVKQQQKLINLYKKQSKQP